MKRIALLICIMLCWSMGFAHAGIFSDTINTQAVTFTSIGTNSYSTDLGEFVVGKGGLVFWWISDASASDDYDIHFFTKDDGTWSDLINTVDNIYSKSGIVLSTTIYTDDTVFPFVSTDTTNILYAGIYNDDDSNASTFSLRVFWYSKSGVSR